MLIELLVGDSTSQSGVLGFLFFVYFLNQDLGSRKSSLANKHAYNEIFIYIIHL